MKTLIVLISTLIAMGCQRSEFGASASAATQPDPNEAKITVTGQQVADGVTPSTINIWITNYKGEPLVNYHVDITVSGTGNTILPCTVTDQNGLAQCWLVTTVPEHKTVTLVGTTKTAPALFAAPKDQRDGGNFVAAGDAQKTPSGATIITSLDFLGPFESRDVSQTVRLRSTHLGLIFAELQ